jgi:putative endonuclease
MRTNENTKQIGDFGERMAVRYLRLHGYTVKERNWRSGHMEIDVIAENLSTVAFVEVKARTYTKQTLDLAPPPSNAVHGEKQRLTRKAAKDYLWQHPTRKQPRMDVIEVWLVRDEKTDKPKVAKINHIKAAY